MINWYKIANIKKTSEHDYQPHWDYEEEEDLFKYSTLVNAFGQAKEEIEMLVLSSFDFCDGFDVFFAKNIPRDKIAMYVDGTYSHPVIIVDLEAIDKAMDKHYVRGQEEQIARDTIMHELTHAVQEAEGREYDEEEAEGSIIDFPVVAEIDELMPTRTASTKTYHIEHESFARAFQEMEGISLTDTNALEEWADYKELIKNDDPALMEEEKDGILFDIYGNGGSNRYYVRRNGQIAFSGIHAQWEAERKAKRLGFDII